MAEKNSIRFTPTDKILEGAGIISLLALIGIPWTYYRELPPEIPSHYCFRRLPDDWSGKASIWTLPFIGFFLYAGMTLLNRFVVTKISAQDAAQEAEPVPRKKILTMMQALKLFLTLSFTYIVWTTVKVSQGSAVRLGAWFLPTFIVLMTFLPILLLVAGTFQKKK